jgi:ribonuclease PH
VEVQGTAEGQPFSREEMDGLMDLAWKGIGEFLTLQVAALREGRGG